MEHPALALAQECVVIARSLGCFLAFLMGLMTVRYLRG